MCVCVRARPVTLVLMFMIFAPSEGLWESKHGTGEVGPTQTEHLHQLLSSSLFVVKWDEKVPDDRRERERERGV